MTDTWFVNAGLVFALATVLWAFSVKLRDVSIVDPWWSVFFLLISVNTWRSGAEDAPKLLLLGCVGFWSLRLWAHLLVRARGKGEDPRYAAMREKVGESFWWKSLFSVFYLQAFLSLLISAPLVLSFAAPPTDAITLWDAAGLILFATGFVIEVVADWQLQRFRNDPKRDGVFRAGLWGRSRHPNYFGEAVLWWGFGAFALDATWGWLALLSPALMTLLLLRVSGVSMLDAHMKRTKPKYEDYVREVPAFVPRLNTR